MHACLHNTHACVHVPCKYEHEQLRVHAHFACQHISSLAIDNLDNVLNKRFKHTSTHILTRHTHTHFLSHTYRITDSRVPSSNNKILLKVKICAVRQKRVPPKFGDFAPDLAPQLAVHGQKKQLPRVVGRSRRSEIVLSSLPCVCVCVCVYGHLAWMVSRDMDMHACRHVN